MRYIGIRRMSKIMMNVNVKLVNREMVERYLRMLDGIELNSEGKVITGADTVDETSCCVQSFDVKQDTQITFSCYEIAENEDHFYIKHSAGKGVTVVTVLDKEDIKQIDIEYTNKKYPRYLEKYKDINYLQTFKDLITEYTVMLYKDSGCEINYEQQKTIELIEDLLKRNIIIEDLLKKKKERDK